MHRSLSLNGWDMISHLKVLPHLMTCMLLRLLVQLMRRTMIMIKRVYID